MILDKIKKVKENNFYTLTTDIIINIIINLKLYYLNYLDYFIYNST